MSDKEGSAGKDKDATRLLRFKDYTSLNSLYQTVKNMDEGKDDTPFSLTFLKDRTAEIISINKRLVKHSHLLEEKEEDEDQKQADADLKEEIYHRSYDAVKLCNNLQVWKTVTMLIESTAEELETVESMRAEDPTIDISFCLPAIQKQVDEMSQHMKDYTGPLTDRLWTNTKALRVRLVKATAQRRVDVKPVTVIKSEYEHDFKIPKVNIPKFKGGLESWHAFWSRFKTAVDENVKLSEPVKLAVLIDLVIDPALNEYLVAANDGQEGRYAQIVSYLKTRFDRPRELHQIYCKKLTELPPNKGTPAELSMAADTVFAAVSGLKRSGQADIDAIATSLVVSTLPPQLRLEWETKTEEEHQVPHIDKWIAFMRKKATNAEQSQKHSIPNSAHKKQEKPTQKSTGKVHIASSQPTAGPDSVPQKQKNKGSRSTNSSCQNKCSLCSNMHYIFQCSQFQEMDVAQRKTHVQSASLCSNCLN